MMRFVQNQLRPGDIVHVRSNTWYGALIRKAVGSWGNHDALVVFENGRPMIADAEPPRANVCAPFVYEEALHGGVLAGIRVYRPAPFLADPAAGALASAWWLTHVLGRTYDYAAIVRLLLKALTADLFPWPVGWRWAWYCTEGVRDAYLKGAAVDIYLKNNPTPRTTEKRVEAGWLVDVTELVTFDADRAEAVARRNHEPVFAPWHPGEATA